MNKLIEIAKANGAHVNYGYVAMSPDELRATIEHVCAPLVDVLELVEKDITDYMKHRDTEKLLFAIGVQLVRIRAALPAHRALIGDKHE